MNKLSTLPVGYKPTSLSEIRTYCQGNNGYFIRNRSTILTYDWRTDDGVTFGQNDGTGCGVTVKNTNIFSDSMSSGWRLDRLGNKSARATWFYGDLGSIGGGVFDPNGTSAFIANAVGIAFKFSKADTRVTRTERKQNDATECRIQRVAGVYVEGGTGNNGKIYSYNYGTVATGSLGFNASSIATNDKFCCYMAGNSTGRTNIKDKQLLLIGWLFDLYFNHNGTGEQNPSGQFWSARPVISHSTSDNGNTSKPNLMLAYPFENTKWQDANPLNSGKMLKFNQARA